MQHHQYPHFAAHCRQHRDLTEQVLALNERRGRGERIATPELLAFLKDWLERHITVADKDIGRYLKSTAGTP